mmetsp:Transcript_28052/g.82445  ORF Transcript_28052/g.82445 Transcript_28052/m.82445 type:complete len:259 (-) Transcript_28052:645-1421(-)
MSRCLSAYVTSSSSAGPFSSRATPCRRSGQWTRRCTAKSRLRPPSRATASAASRMASVRSGMQNSTCSDPLRRGGCRPRASSPAPTSSRSSSRTSATLCRRGRAWRAMSATPCRACTPSCRTARGCGATSSSARTASGPRCAPRCTTSPSCADPARLPSTLGTRSSPASATATPPTARTRATKCTSAHSSTSSSPTSAAARCSGTPLWPCPRASCRRQTCSRTSRSGTRRGAMRSILSWTPPRSRRWSSATSTTASPW